MGIRDKIQTKLAAALNDADKLGDVSRSIEHEDATTTVKTTGRAFSPKYKDRETDGESVQVTELTLQILQNELSVEPKIDDYIHIDGRSFIIETVTPTPSNTKWTITGTA